MTYLDNASTSCPKPACVLEGIEYYLRYIGGNPYRANHKLAYRAGQLVFETRELLSRFLGVNDPNKISFTYNATYALNVLLKGFLKTGDHVIISSYEHNSVLRPLHELTKSHNVTYDVWKCDQQGRFSLEELEKLINPKTRLLFFSHTSNVIGTVIPLEEISLLAKKRKLTLGLDVTQSVGHINVDLEAFGVDMAAGTCHKALLGPSGLGFLYVRDPDEVDSLVQGSGGFLSSLLDHPDTCPAKYEAGTINYLGVAGLRSSLEWLIPRQRRLQNKTKVLFSMLKAGLQKMPHITVYAEKAEPIIPIISFNVNGISAGQIESFLEAKNNIFVRAGLQCAPLMHEALGTLPHGTVRVSLGPFNQRKDVRKIIEALSRITMDS